MKKNRFFIIMFCYFLFILLVFSLFAKEKKYFIEIRESGSFTVKDTDMDSTLKDGYDTLAKVRTIEIELNENNHTPKGSLTILKDGKLYNARDLVIRHRDYISSEVVQDTTELEDTTK